FSVAVIGLAGAAILYDTSKIMRDFPVDRHVAASLQLFASVALMFWYVLQLFMARDGERGRAAPVPLFIRMPPPSGGRLFLSLTTPPIRCQPPTATPSAFTTPAPSTTAPRSIPPKAASRSSSRSAAARSSPPSTPA